MIWEGTKGSELPAKLAIESTVAASGREGKLKLSSCFDRGYEDISGGSWLSICVKRGFASIWKPSPLAKKAATSLGYIREKTATLG